MNAVGWMKLKSDASSVGGKMKVLKSLHQLLGIETSAITLENIQQCTWCLLTLSRHMTYYPTVLFLSTQPVRMVAYIRRNFLMFLILFTLSFFSKRVDT